MSSSTLNKMKAAILVESKQPLVVANLEMPEILSFGQVHVRIFYSGICGAQINEIDASKGPDKFLPHLLGHEGVGEVLRTGDGVKRVKSGDRVVLHWRPAGGLQANPAMYKWNGKIVNAGWVTTFNDEAIISENRLTVIPKTFDMQQAPLFGCAVTTAVGVVNNDAQLGIGQSIVVIGVGGVGLNIIQAAAMVSANPIIGVDIVDSKLEAAKKWGATNILNSSQQSLETLRGILGVDGADVVVETTGNPRIIEAAYDLTSADGRTILVGVPKKDQKASIYTLPLHFKKILKGSHGGSSSPDIEIPRLIRLINSGKMSLNGFVTNIFKLDQINEGIDLLRTGEAGRILIDMENHE